jgi:DNA-binding protein YbaB
MAKSVDRDANGLLRARLDEVYGQYERLRAGMGQLRERLAALKVTAASDDKLINATVGPRGQLIELRLDPDVYRVLKPEQLARAVVATVQSATAQVGHDVNAVMAEYLPADSAAMTYLRGNDLGAMMSRFDQRMADLPPDESR